MSYGSPERHACTQEARKVREARRNLQHDQAEDSLQERARLLAQWARAQFHYHPAARACPRFPLNHSLYRNPVFWRHLLPGLRARLEAKHRAHDAAWRAELRAHGERARQLKAERDAAKRRAASPQQELLP